MYLPRSAYDIVNRKLFSLPKLLILPGVISRQPMLLVKIFPFIFVTDMVKGRMVAFVTDRVEQFQREARDVNSIRQKVEQFDMKNAELVSIVSGSLGMKRCCSSSLIICPAISYYLASQIRNRCNAVHSKSVG